MKVRVGGDEGMRGCDKRGWDGVSVGVMRLLYTFIDKAALTLCDKSRGGEGMRGCDKREGEL